MSYRTRGQSSGRVLTANAALVITDTDCVGFGTIIIASTNTAAVAATFSWGTPSDDLGGGAFTVYMATRSSSGSYTIAATYGGTAGTVTFDAQHEAADFHRIGTTLYCTRLTGATFA